jgi:20S proteasome alpha/beta subunit
MTDTLAGAVAARRAADDAAAVAREALNEAIRADVAAGRPVADIVYVTGLTRARIYQIRDHRR